MSVDYLPSWVLKSLKKSVLAGVWEGLGGFLGPSWTQDGPKSQEVSRRTPDGLPLDPQVGVPNPLKIELTAIQNLIIFLIASRLSFKGFGPPTWGSSGGPSGVRRATFWLLGPSWIQDGPHTPPRPLQDLPKTPPRHLFKGFWSLLG